MDPALFRIDWQVVTELLGTIVVLSFFIERALSVLFENRHFIARFDRKGVKEPIAFIVSLLVVIYWKFDALGVLMHADKMSYLGYAVTAAIISGGSKASIKFFHDVIKYKSSALLEAEKAQKAGG